ncbi:MAG: hypothetical protein ABWK01_06395 [Infirmifilum sp.]
MGVRVRIRVELAGKIVETAALANSGFETEDPQLLVPHAFLLRNGISVESLGKPVVAEYDTAGGPVSAYAYPGACVVAVVEEDRVSRSVRTDLVISLIEREVLMSDALIEELGIVILSPKRGLWRFSDDPPQEVRQSCRPQYW